MSSAILRASTKFRPRARSPWWPPGSALQTNRALRPGRGPRQRLRRRLTTGRFSTSSTAASRRCTARRCCWSSWAACSPSASCCSWTRPQVGSDASAACAASCAVCGPTATYFYWGQRFCWWRPRAWRGSRCSSGPPGSSIHSSSAGCCLPCSPPSRWLIGWRRRR